MNIKQHLQEIDLLSKKDFIKYLELKATKIIDKPKYYPSSTRFWKAREYILVLEDATLVYGVCGYWSYDKLERTAISYDVFDKDTNLCTNRVQENKDTRYYRYYCDYKSVSEFLTIKGILAKHVLERWEHWLKHKAKAIAILSDQPTKTEKINSLYRDTIEHGFNTETSVFL